MGFFDYFRSTRHPNSAAVAKERLQIIVAHERGDSRRKSPAYLPALKQELLSVVRKYVHVDPEQIKVHVDREGDYEVLELNITLPEEEPAQAPAADGVVRDVSGKRRDRNPKKHR